MKKGFHKALSVMMAVVVLFTTMSFTVDMHYCGNSLVDFRFFTKTEGCGMEKPQPVKSCENPSMSEKSCCTDQQIVKKGEEDLKTSFNKLTFEQQNFVATFFYTTSNPFVGVDEFIVHFIDYSPPFLERDVQILYGTYLI